MPTIPLVVLGPNPAAFTELLWWLVSQGEVVPAAFVVLESGHARGHWETEVLAPDAAFDELCTASPNRLPERSAVHVSIAVDSTGLAPADAQSAGIADALAEPLWATARSAIALAGHDTVLFALSGGRWRGSNALITTAYQLLARSWDRLVDVRVSNPVAEGGTGFFFPDQLRQILHGRGRYQGRGFEARDISVRVDDIPTPRLRPLLPDVVQFHAFADAVAASNAAIDLLRTPELVLDLLIGACRIDGKELHLCKSHFALYAFLVAAARTNTRKVVGNSAAKSPLASRLGWFLHRHHLRYEHSMEADWVKEIHSGHLDDLVKNPGYVVPDDDKDIVSGLWTKMRINIKKFCTNAKIPKPDMIIPISSACLPEGGRGGTWHIGLPATHITIIGLVEDWDPLG